MSESEAIELSVQIAAGPETVFRYFTDPSRYVLWMGADASLEPVPGGAYRVWMREGVEASGEFVEVDPPHRLEFTWGWAHNASVPPGSTRVVVTFEAVDGGTLVVLRHHGLPDQAQRDHHREGWVAYLERLATHAHGHDPGPDPNEGS